MDKTTKQIPVYYGVGILLLLVITYIFMTDNNISRGARKVYSNIKQKIFKKKLSSQPPSQINNQVPSQINNQVPSQINDQQIPYQQQYPVNPLTTTRDFEPLGAIQSSQNHCSPIEKPFYNPALYTAPKLPESMPQPSNINYPYKQNGKSVNPQQRIVQVPSNVPVVKAKYTPTPDSARFPTLPNSWYPASQSFVPYHPINPEEIVLNYNY